MCARTGLPATYSIPLGCVYVCGRSRTPKPAVGIIALTCPALTAWFPGEFGESPSIARPSPPSVRRGARKSSPRTLLPMASYHLVASSIQSCLDFARPGVPLRGRVGRKWTEESEERMISQGPGDLRPTNDDHPCPRSARCRSIPQTSALVTRRDHDLSWHRGGHSPLYRRRGVLLALGASPRLELSRPSADDRLHRVSDHSPG